MGLRLALATAAAALLTGCSDATRFSSDPFSNPFASASAPVDRTATGSIAPRRNVASNDQIESRPLAPPAGSAALPAPVTSPQPEPVASRATPAPHGSWSAEGGTPIVVAQGESIGMLATRYGVPATALLSANGYSSASQVTPGARIVIPVYRNGAAAAPVHVAAPAPVHAAAPSRAPTPVARIEPMREQKKETYKLVKGPEAVNAGASKAAHGKVARADDEEDEAPTAKAPAKIEKPKPHMGRAAEIERKTAEIERKADRRKKLEAKKDDDDDAQPAPVEKAKPATRKFEVVEPAKPDRRARVQNAEVDRQPTASLPPVAAVEQAAPSDSANPEFRWPAHGRIIQSFKANGNDGINIAVPEGTAVKAAEGGVVKYAGDELKGYGNLILIQHPNGFVSAYAHNGELDVKRGDTVKRGQTIAKAGQTGNVTTPQVHFELRKGQTPVDPTGYLAGL